MTFVIGSDVLFIYCRDEVVFHVIWIKQNSSLEITEITLQKPSDIFIQKY